MAKVQKGQHAGGKEQSTGTRRRGEILENEILQAAWDELKEAGYAQLTMESVAVRAKTNKTAIYRRWPNKPKLIIAALQKNLPKPFTEVPNTGNLRSDVLMLLRKITQPMQAIGAETIHGLMVDYLGKEIFSSIPQMKGAAGKGKWNTVMMTILQNAEKRGEVNLEQINPRVVSLPINLLQYEFLTTYEPVSDETVTEIVDVIFLPLVVK